MLQDLRYGIRRLLKNPTFTLVAVATLAIGIGATTAVFSVVNSFLLRALPYHQPERLVALQSSSDRADYRSVYSYDVLKRVSEQSTSLTGVAGFANQRLTLEGEAQSEVVFGSRVTHNFFSVVGTSPFLGRTFLADDAEPGKPKLVVLSYALWQRHFGGQSVVGKTFTADKELITIVGVMPADFRTELLPEFPKVDFWMLLQPNPRASHINEFRLLGRLKDDHTLQQLRHELAAVENALQANNPAAGTARSRVTLGAILLQDFFAGDARKPLLLLFGAVGFVLLIACANVASLMSAYSVARQKEIAIRAVLGAGRRRLLRQLFMETLLLSVAGGLVGLLLLRWSLHLIVWLLPKWMTRMGEVTIDRRVLLFTLTTSLLTGILFGLLPVLRGSSPDLQSTLKRGSANTTAGLRNLRGFLVVNEVALAVVLLIGAGLLMNSFVRLINVDLGFRTENILTMHLRLLARSSQAEQVAFADESLRRIRNIPGVTSAALASSLPMEAGSTISNKRRALLEAPFSGDPESRLQISPNFVSPDYFRTFGLELKKGQFLDATAGIAGNELPVVVNEQLARNAWPNEDPLGKRLAWSWIEGKRPVVIGIVKDTRQPNQEPGAVLYAPYNQNPDTYAALAIKTSIEPNRIAGTVREQIMAVDRRVVLEDVLTVEQSLSEQVAQPRFYAVLLAWFAGIGLLLALVGLYGVMSYTVTLQTREVGIRVALGAQPRDVLKLIVSHGLLLTLCGLALGLAAAFALSRLLSSMLFEITSTDPFTIITMSTFILLTALVACWIPARRATKVDALTALRHE